MHRIYGDIATARRKALNVHARQCADPGHTASRGMPVRVKSLEHKTAHAGTNIGSQVFEQRDRPGAPAALWPLRGCERRARNGKTAILPLLARSGMSALTGCAKLWREYGVLRCAYASNSPKKDERSDGFYQQAGSGFWGMTSIRRQVALLPGANLFYIRAAAATG
jgi:hypothetical protein